MFSSPSVFQNSGEIEGNCDMLSSSSVSQTSGKIEENRNMLSSPSDFMAWVEMNSSSRDTLLKPFDNIIQWRQDIKMCKAYYVVKKFNWNEDHLRVVRNYVSKLPLINPDSRLLDSARLFNTMICLFTEVNSERVASFMQDLEEIFSVPKLIERGTLNKNEVIAAFIDFLLQLLYDHQRYLRFDPFKDPIDSLQKGLRFLLMVLGDAPFLRQEHEQVQIILLPQLEAVANEAGSFVFSRLFSTSEDPDFKNKVERVGALLKHMDLLKGTINSPILKFSPILAKSGRNSKMSSLFIVDSLLYDLENLLNRDGSLIIGDVKGQIKILREELLLSQSLLEAMQLPPPQSEIHELKEHVTRITDVAFEAEYLINSFFAGDAPLWYFNIRLPHVLHEIKLIGIGLQEIKDNYNIGALKPSKSFSTQLLLQRKRNSEFDDNVVGFEGGWVTNILDHLVGGTKQLQIISIFGMPGLGKTTFAKKLYNDPMVNYRFDKCSWCVVSQMYQRRSLLADILISLRIETDKDEISNMEEESLAEDIYKSLKGRRYLIIMDDVWDSKAWGDQRRFFPDDGNGSRILFTTRHKDVSPPNSIICELPCLSNDQCWELLEKTLINNAPCPSESLRMVGKQIAANCHGLPLVVVVIAGILSNMDQEESAWKKVGENLSSYISCGGNDSMMQILGLSYKHLPKYLKPCFLYFGSFAEDEEIPAQYLIRLWIAEGFISKGDRNSSENLAKEYLLELIDKSLVIVAKRGSNGGVKSCVVHDLLRDLCLKISAEESFMKWVVDEEDTIYQKSHRLVKSVADRSDQLVQSPFGQHVRSFHFPGYNHIGDRQSFFVGNMKLLRVLDFTTDVYPLSRVRWIGVEYLVNLRHLVINELPSTICSLVNLEYLAVRTEFSVTDIKIPSAILKMDKLRHLHFMGRRAVFDEDCNSSQTNNIEVLSCVRIRNEKDAEMLKCSPHLHKLKCVCYPIHVQDQYPDLDLLFFDHLESLTMRSITYSKYDRELEINFPSKIKKLNLEGLKLPWEKMSIIGGLPNLQVLKLERDAFIGKTWETTDEEFQELRFLKMYSIYSLKQWNVASSQHFPKLQRLVLRYCRSLEEIPCEIGEIVALQSIEVYDCAETVDESARKIEQEQRDMGNEDLKVIIS